jgi:hypothetical protein
MTDFCTANSFVVRLPKKSTVKNLCRAPRAAHDKEKLTDGAPVRRLGDGVEHSSSCARVETHDKQKKEKN